MKILEVIAGFGSGGAETLLKDIAIGFKEKDHEVVVIIMDELSNDVSEISKINQLRANGIEVISLDRKPADRSLGIFFKIFKLIKKHRPSVIHIHSFLAALYFFPFSFYFFKIKFVQTIHSTRILESKLRKLFYTKLFTLKYKNIYCSDEVSNCLTKALGEGIVIDNGISSHKNRNIRNFIEEEYSIPPNSLIALNVGRITEAKNQLLLLNLIEKLNNQMYKGSLYLLVCGQYFNDSLYENLMTHYNQLKFKDNIKFIGVKDYVNDLMYSTDLYISTSIFEGLPITVLEAMNTGVPIILSPIKEHLNVFSDLQTCYFPENNTVDSYVALFQNKKIFDTNREKVIAERDFLIKKYDIKTTILKYLDCFEDKL